MRFLILFLSLGVGCSEVALSADRVTGSPADPIRDAISLLQPRLSARVVSEIADVIRTQSKEFGVAWQLLVSIAYNESSLGLHTVNATTQDYGLMQINIRNIRRLGYTARQVLNDRKIGVRIACKLIAENRKKYANRFPFWLGIYRSGTNLKEKRIRASAKSYDGMIRRTAALIGYSEPFGEEYYAQNYQ